MFVILATKLTDSVAKILCVYSFLTNGAYFTYMH